MATHGCHHNAFVCICERPDFMFIQKAALSQLSLLGGLGSLGGGSCVIVDVRAFFSAFLACLSSRRFSLWRSEFSRMV